MRTVCIDIQWLQCGRIEVLGLFFRIQKVMNHLLQSTETDTVLHHLKTNKRLIWIVKGQITFIDEGW